MDDERFANLVSDIFNRLADEGLTTWESYGILDVVKVGLYTQAMGEDDGPDLKLVKGFQKKPVDK